MICELCGEKEATILLKKVINSEESELRLCETCAAANGLDVNNLALTDVLFGAGVPRKDKAEPVVDKTCLLCHMRFTDFRKTSRLGCQACYETFSQELEPMLEGMQKSLQHVGKHPVPPAGGARVGASIVALRKALEVAVASEQFEEAARLRDQILQRTGEAVTGPPGASEKP